MAIFKKCLNLLSDEIRIIGFFRYLYNQYRESKLMQYTSDQFAFFGKNVCIDRGVNLYHSNSMIIKEGAVIHKGTTINACGGFMLGRFSGISYNCTILTVEHKILKAKSVPFDNRIFLKPVVIEDFVMVGTNVSILPGVKVGEGAVIGIGSVVVKDVAPLSIVRGNPATVIGHRDKNSFEKLKREGFHQSPIVGDYEKSIPLNMKRKYAALIEDLGIDDCECKMHNDYADRPVNCVVDRKKRSN